VYSPRRLENTTSVGTGHHQHRPPGLPVPRSDDNPPTPATRAGIVTIVGRPNVGKSTLLNRLVGEKLAITSEKPQSTRDRVVGIRTESGVQMVFLDTPGLLEPRYALHGAMLATARRHSVTPTSSYTCRT
jgi:ribosome biogenesis GTPase A